MSAALMPACWRILCFFCPACLVRLMPSANILLATQLSCQMACRYCHCTCTCSTRQSKCMWHEGIALHICIYIYSLLLATGIIGINASNARLKDFLLPASGCGTASWSSSPSHSYRNTRATENFSTMWKYTTVTATLAQAQIA